MCEFMLQRRSNFLLSYIQLFSSFCFYTAQIKYSHFDSLWVFPILIRVSKITLQQCTKSVVLKVVFTIKIGDEETSTITIGLFGKTVPKTVKNFIELSKKAEGVCLITINGFSFFLWWQRFLIWLVRPFNRFVYPDTWQTTRIFIRFQEGYTGSKFHRIIADFMVQGGDFTKVKTFDFLKTFSQYMVLLFTSLFCMVHKITLVCLRVMVPAVNLYTVRHSPMKTSSWSIMVRDG